MDSAHDGWKGLSRDVIDRFIDVMRVEQAAPRSMEDWRGELLGLDDWMRCHCGRTLVTARQGALREYMRARMREGIEPVRLARLLACLGRFYRYLWRSGCRPDLVRIAPIGVPARRVAAHNALLPAVREGR